MLLINLIAARRAERHKLEMIRAGIMRGMLGVGAIAGAGAMFMTLSMSRTNSRISDVDAQTALLQDTVAQVERLQASMSALKPKVETLTKAQNTTNRWRAALQEVSASLPDKTWITSFSSQASPAEGFLLNGQTISQDRVGRTMLKLNKVPYLKSVDLHFSTAAQDGKGINFELAATMGSEEGTANGS